MKTYVIADFQAELDAYQILNDSTKLIADTWFSTIPYKCIDELPKPKIFINRSDAVLFKDKAQTSANLDWNKNGHIHKMYGHNKPKYTIYEYNVYQKNIERIHNY